MAKPRVFLGSSGRAYRLVDWLAQQLRKHELATPVEWKFDAFEAGTSTLDNLIGNCWECDLAVIFLTEDDAIEKSTAGTKGAQKRYVPRDNCIFEAGLFLGALGLDAGRCLLVSSLELNALPTDLAGITVVTMPKLNGLYDLTEDWCDERLQAVFARVKHHVEKYNLFLRRPVLRVLTKKQLFEREDVGEGNVGSHLRKGESVVVNSIEPLERDDWGFARQVMKNVAARIQYHYFFRGDEGNASHWIELLRMLVLAGVARDDTTGVAKQPPENDDEKMGVLKEHHPQVEKVINEIKEYVAIHLLGRRERFALKVIMHNAQSDTSAECYLRYTTTERAHDQLDGKADWFVHWCSGPEAKEIGEQLFNLRAKNEVDQKIFRGTRSFHLESQASKSAKNARKAISNAIKKLFPEPLCGVIEEACLKKSGPEIEVQEIVQEAFQETLQKIIVQETLQKIRRLGKELEIETYNKSGRRFMRELVRDRVNQLVLQWELNDYQPPDIGQLGP